MPTRSKPVSVLKTEGKSHRTKAELEAREKAEKRLLSGLPMKEKAEVKADKYAHIAYTRVKRILAAIDKNDALYEAVINRYCVIAAEVVNSQKERQRVEKMLELLDVQLDEGEIETDDYIKRGSELTGKLLGLDSNLQKKRKMLLDIEKENCMTVASALRAIPKTPEDEDADDPMSLMLRQRLGQG